MARIALILEVKDDGQVVVESIFRDGTQKSKAAIQGPVKKKRRISAAGRASMRAAAQRRKADRSR